MRRGGSAEDDDHEKSKKKRRLEKSRMDKGSKKGKVATKKGEDRVCEKEVVQSVNSRASIARKAKAKVLMVPDGIADDDEGALDEYADDE